MPRNLRFRGILIDCNSPIRLPTACPAKLMRVFDCSPVFQLESDAKLRDAFAAASVGEGKIFLLGPEVACLGQPRPTCKFLFNGLHYGPAKEVALK